MKKLGSIFLLAIFVLGLGATSFAHTPVINKRQHNQSQRIRRGIRTDELTRREAGRLISQQAAIRAYEARAKSDGRLNYRERRRLDYMLDRANRNIYRQKHDGQDR
jgi:hypothetical protein